MSDTSPGFSKLFLLVFMLLTALACPAFSEDIKALINKAEGGDAEAHFNLGGACYDGQGVPQDYALAYFWFSLSASRMTGEDYNRSAEARDKSAKRLTPEQPMKAQQMTREWEEKHPRNRVPSSTYRPPHGDTSPLHASLRP